MISEPTLIQEMIEYQQELYMGEASRLGVAMKVEDGDANAKCEIDRSALIKVLGHVIVNALRYSPRGQSVDISWHRNDQNLIIDIADRGPGVPKAIRSNLDEPFSIGQEVLTKDASGLGLGLTICRHLMTMMGGRIAIEDRTGGGALVSLILPYRQG
jgi:signal transduction histidine kinase